MSDFLEGFTPAEIATINAAGTELTVPEGWSPMWEGTGPDKAYLIRKGEVAIKHGATEIARIGPGDIVGEASIVNHTLRNATVVALTPLEILRLSKDEVERLAQEMPHFKSALEKAVERHMSKVPE